MDVHPHAIRSSKAIHLLESGVNIIAIRDFLGHTSVSTTQVYLRVNNQAKRDAIAQAYPSLVEDVPPCAAFSSLPHNLRPMFQPIFFRDEPCVYHYPRLLISPWIFTCGFSRLVGDNFVWFQLRLVDGGLFNAYFVCTHLPYNFLFVCINIWCID